MTDSPLEIQSFEEPSFGENGYVISTTGDDGRSVGWIVDPGFPPQVTRMLDYASRKAVRVERIMLTHGHVDHISGVDEVRQRYPDARVAIAAGERGALNNPDENLSSLMGMPLVLNTQADDDLPAGGELRLGSTLWQVLDVSGHSPAGRALYCPAAGVVLTGDALFAGGIGRYDFPGSDGRRLLANIRQNLLRLPDETRIYSGHGPPTTVGNERKNNPYVAE